MLQDIALLFQGDVPSVSSDRRLSARLSDNWYSLRQEGVRPSWEDFQRIELGEDWGWVFVLDVKKSVGFPYFIFLGENLARLSDVYLSGQTDWTVSLLEKAAGGIDETINAGEPVQRNDELQLCDGRIVRLRAVTAPLTNAGGALADGDGQIFSHVIGAVSGRIFEQASPNLQS